MGGNRDKIENWGINKCNSQMHQSSLTGTNGMYFGEIERLLPKGMSRGNPQGILQCPEVKNLSILKSRDITLLTKVEFI